MPAGETKHGGIFREIHKGKEFESDTIGFVGGIAT
jgi:hypothetical protein